MSSSTVGPKRGTSTIPIKKEVSLGQWKREGLPASTVDVPPNIEEIDMPFLGVSTITIILAGAIFALGVAAIMESIKCGKNWLEKHCLYWELYYFLRSSASRLFQHRS